MKLISIDFGFSFVVVRLYFKSLIFYANAGFAIRAISVRGSGGSLHLRARRSQMNKNLFFITLFEIILILFFTPVGFQSR